MAIDEKTTTRKVERDFGREVRPAISAENMHAVIVAKDVGLARSVFHSATGITAGISVVGEVRELRHAARCDKYVYVELDNSPSNLKRLAAAVNDIASQHPYCVVIPVDVASCRMLASIRDELFCELFPSPQVDLLDLLDDKWQFYLLCNGNKIATPKTFFLGEKTTFSFETITQTITPPILIKPTNQRDGLGIVVVANQDEFDRFVLKNETYQYAPLIAQQFIPGRDIDISVLAMRGQIVCSAVQTRSGPHVRFLQHQSLFHEVDRLIKHIGYTGIIHFDAREHGGDGSIWLIEANPRFWGTMNAARWCGLNFTIAGMELALGQPLSERAFLESGCYPGFARALLEMATGRQGPRELSRKRRAFLLPIISDPYEHVHGASRLASRLGRKLWRPRRSNGLSVGDNGASTAAGVT